MSGESQVSEQLDGGFSTPAPELLDHRHPRRPAPRNESELSRELQQAAAGQQSAERNGFLQVNDARRDPAVRPRDLEQAIVDDDRSDRAVDLAGLGRRGSIRERRLTNRQGRPQFQERIDRSRDSSSSGSTSPPNSVEAFADPRRRERANTLESHAPSLIEVLNRRPSAASAWHRPSVSNASRLQAGTLLGDDNGAEDDVGFPTYEEPGKTYKIDYEELEEFVALSAQGLIPDQPPAGRPLGVRGASSAPKVFHDLRKGARRQDVPQILMNCESLYNQEPLQQLSSDDSTRKPANDADEKASLRDLIEKKDRFTLFSSATESVTYGAELGAFVSDGITTFRDLFELGPDGGVWWLDVTNPTSAELECLRKAFKIHPLTNEDIEQQETREKVELFSQYYFVCFRSFHSDATRDDFLQAVNVYIIVCDEGVLSFSFSDTPHAANVRKRINKSRDFVNLGSDYICYALIDDIVDSFAPVIRTAERESESIEDQVYVARDDDYTSMLRHIGESRKNVLSMMRLLGGKADVIKGFAKRCNDQYSVTPRGEIGVYLGDIQDHVITMMSSLGHVEKMLSRSHANYLAQLNVDHLLKGNHTNKTLSKITVLATILVPLNLICGLFGMNVPVPGRETTSLAWFFGIVGVICAIVISCIITARKLKVI